MPAMPAGAIRISSRATFFSKWVLPAIWYGCALYMVLYGAVSSHFDLLITCICLFFACLSSGLGYALFHGFTRDFMDEIWDNGDELLVVNGGQVEHIALADIMEISPPSQTRPPRITITLRQAGRWGQVLTFLPPSGPGNEFTVTANPGFSDLIRRISQARRATANSANSSSASR